VKKSKVHKATRTITGATAGEDGKAVCDKCGKSDKFKATMFLDGNGFYQQHYTCECGNAVVVTGRTEADHE